MRSGPKTQRSDLVRCCRFSARRGGASIHADRGCPPFTLLVALVWQCRGWLLAAVGRAVSPCHF